jgi:phosphoenolpyruvate synthase/pyruvate phosphate dikinase
MQRGDFEAIFRAMEGYPVTIRLLDPPLHEFLPKEPSEAAGSGSSTPRSPRCRCGPSSRRPAPSPPERGG